METFFFPKCIGCRYGYSPNVWYFGVELDVDITQRGSRNITVGGGSRMMSSSNWDGRTGDTAAAEYNT